MIKPCYSHKLSWFSRKQVFGASMEGNIPAMFTPAVYRLFALHVVLCEQLSYNSQQLLGTPQALSLVPSPTPSFSSLLSTRFTVLSSDEKLGVGLGTRLSSSGNGG